MRGVGVYGIVTLTLIPFGHVYHKIKFWLCIFIWLVGT